MCALSAADMRDLISYYPEVLPKMLRVYSRRVTRFSQVRRVYA